VLLNDSYLLDAGWLFFAAWSVVIAFVSVTAFGRDLLPWQARLDPAESHATQADRPREPRRG
jgi:hypothetical protein